MTEPVASAHVAVGPPVLAGRDRELALRDQLAAAATTRGRLLLFGGEAGIGKSALVLTGHSIDEA